jgi:hypothetical protein
VRQIVFRDLGLKRVLQHMGAFGKYKLRVGVVGDAAAKPARNGRLTVGETAALQEFGTSTAPARPFVAPVVNDKGPIRTLMTNAVVRVLNANESVFDALAKVGERVAGMIQHKVESYVPPPNAESTIRQKGFDHPLLETGQLHDSIGYRIEGGEGGVIDDLESFGDMGNIEEG